MKDHVMPYMSFATFDANSFLVSDGFRILQSDNGTFKDWHISVPNEDIQSIYFNQQDSSLLCYASHSGSKGFTGNIYSIDIKTKKQKLLRHFEEYGNVVFINGKRLVYIAKNEAKKVYEFSIYDIK